MTMGDERLLAWLDGELDPMARAEVEAALAADAALRDRLEKQRRLRDRLAAHYGPVAAEPVPARLRALLDPKVVDLRAARARRARPAWQGFAALAASLVLGIAVGTQVPPGGSGPIAVRGGAIVARGPLADALDRQLASAQRADAPTRIGVSFARADGQWCRTFDSAALAGLACRDGGRWRLLATAPGSAAVRRDYRQAGSASPLILEAAQEMMTGAPLDAAGERRARDGHWRRPVTDPG
jgi:hypothetical protein